MKKIYLRGLFLMVFTVISLSLSAQQNLFTPVNESASRGITGQRTIIPQKYRTFSLNTMGMKFFLSALPSENNNANKAAMPVMELPMPDGSMAKFNVWETSIMEPGLQAQFPEIRTYSGQGIDDPYATIKMNYDPYFGFSAQVLSIKGSYYIDPYARGNINYYNSYYGRDYSRQTGFVCENPLMPVDEFGKNEQTSSTVTAKCRGAYLYKYRLAIACTGEYAIAATGNPTPTVAETLSRIIASVNRVDGIYESELAIRLILVANNASVVFTDPATDPFTGNDNASTLISESQNVMTTYVGSTNYDIGHTFSTGGGGLATVSCVCSLMKARGITGSPNPVGDAYDVDYVAHEMGHQFGATHTFNSTTMYCSGNWYASTAYEVGSGTSIMSYAGICGTDNIQAHADPFFHTMSFDQITLYLESGATCKVSTATGNTLPVITSMGTSGKYIPRNTPFTLAGTATDANGDALTYSWEEIDLGSSTSWNGAATSTTAPLFKSRVPKTSGKRTFPDMAVILAGYPSDPVADMSGLKGETLPSVARAMKFRLTVRDNRANGGSYVTGGSGCGLTNAFAVNVVNTTGPFAVTAPNGGESYIGGTTQTVTWNVVGTASSPISCTNVMISLSTDGGWTYPIVLLASTPNDGTQAVTMPAIVCSSARIKVEAVGNIFFDISNADFSINAPSTCGDAAGLVATAITTSSATIGWNPVGYADNYDVDYMSATDSTWTHVATGTTATSLNLSGLTMSTTYNWRVRSNCSFGSGNYVMAQFTTLTPPPPCPGPYDVSTNGTIAGAAQIPLNTSVTGKINVSNDIDYYKFVITTGGTITLTLTTLPANFDLSLHNSAGTQIAISKNTGTTNETINATVAAGTYYAKVFPGGNNIFNATSCYTLKVATGTASRPEGEESPVTGPIVFPNPVITTAIVIVPDFDGNSELYVYDMLGKLVIKQQTANKNKSIDLSTLPAGMYMLKTMSNGVELGSTKFIKN